MMPIVEGKVIEEEEFDKLDDEVKQTYENNLQLFKNKYDSYNQIKEIERQSEKKYLNGNQILHYLLLVHILISKEQI